MSFSELTEVFQATTLTFPIFWFMKNRTIIASRGRNPENPGDRKSHSHGRWVQMLELCFVPGKSNTLSTVDKDNYVLEYEEC